MNKIFVRIIAIIMCAALLLGLLSMLTSVLATEIGEGNGRTLIINNRQDFLDFAQNCRLDSFSQGLTVLLSADIDLSGADFAGIPIFCGTFDGAGHSVSGLSITGDGSAQGMFRYLTETAAVRDLTVSGTVKPGGSRCQVGGIVGVNAGTVEDCVFSGNVSGADNVGLIAGVNAVSGVIDHCRAEGDLHGIHFVGGIAGSNGGVIRACENDASVNTTVQQNEVDISDITIDNLMGTESVVTITDLGGIAGSNSGMIRDCENRGDIGYRHMGYNLGGIAGSNTGYIAGCTNTGAVSGRKEVGGIVGQIEPSTLLEYSADTLQLLEVELEKLSDLMDRMAVNASTNTAKIKNLITAIQNHIANAEAAMDVLMPDLEDPRLEKWDTYVGAIELLAASITGIDTSVRELATALEDTTADLEADMKAVSDQLAVIETILGSAEENLGGSVFDVSDDDTDEQFTSEVENCFNFGDVLADINAGGIVGAMALENDLDPEEDVQISGSTSLNVSGYLRAVIRGCASSGTVTVKNQNAGGIVGWQSMGLVRDCISTCILDGAGASYLGGIAGRSAGFIRSCSAKCELEGKAYVGGIAGTGAVVTDCRNMAWVTATEKFGMVLGALTGDYALREDISCNLYAYTQQDIGAIDGISYAGAAQSLALEAFLALEGLEEMFAAVTLRFIFPDGTEQTLQLTPGQMLTPEALPQIPAQTGSTGVWEGLAEAMQHQIVFDRTFRAVYTPCNTVIASDTLRENGLSILLLQGSFPADTLLTVKAWTDAPTPDSITVSEIWQFSLPEGLEAAQARFLLPQECDEGRIRLQVYGSNGWREVEFTRQGSYAVFELQEGDTGIALVETENDFAGWLIICAVVVMAMALAAAIILLCRKKRHQTAPQAAQEETEDENTEGNG